MNGDIILANLAFGQEEILKHWGGVVPEIAARNHLLKITPLIESAFKEAKISPTQIDLISVTTMPGLLGPLLTGLNAAKTLALVFEKPIVPTNHLYSHLEAIHLTEQVSYPYLGLLVSGGHSIFFWVESKVKFHILGSTIDDACGEAFDKGGKMLGLGYPAGHIIDKLASFGNPKAIDFPIGLRASADARLSYSGLKTSLRNYIEARPKLLNKKPTQHITLEPEAQEFYDVCASYQDAIIRALLLKSRYALKTAKEKFAAGENIQIIIGGGVARNSGIRDAYAQKYPGTKFVSPEFCMDNGAMIANFARLNPELAIPFPDCLAMDARGKFIDKKDYI